MESEEVAGLVALSWMVVSLFLMARRIRRGRELAEALATRHPAAYEALGRPRPGYLESVRRARFSQFVGRRGFEKLADGALSARFEAYRKTESRLILSIPISGAVVALIGLALRHTA